MTTTQPTTTGSSRTVVAIASLAAAIPTILSAQGQVALWHDVVHLDATAAIAFACFLETALVASALTARQAIQRGGAGRTDLAATWILSLLSGVLAGAHDVVTRHGDATAVVALSAIARVVAPLVACWLCTASSSETATTPPRHGATHASNDTSSPSPSPPNAPAAATRHGVASSTGADDASYASPATTTSPPTCTPPCDASTTSPPCPPPTP